VPNDVEIAYWNAEAGERWSAFQERIDRAFAPLGAVGIAKAAPKRGEDVLDVGCGCGASSIDVAGTIGAGGLLTGVDVSQPMPAVAKQRASDMRLRNAQFMLADAATHGFGEGVFDLVYSRFGVMFFDDPASAFTNIRRSMRNDGRLVFVCWRALATNPWFTVPMNAVRPHVPQQPRVDPHAPGPLSFADPDHVRGILEVAGFSDIAFAAFDAQLPFGDVAEASGLVSKIGPTSRLLGDANAQEFAVAMAALQDAMRSHNIDGEVMLGAGVWIVSAKPG
jgi:SAM-dependent methyltransferase